MNRQENSNSPTHTVPFTSKGKRVRHKRSLAVSAAAISFASIVTSSPNAVAGFSISRLPANPNPTRVAVRRKSRRTNSLSSGTAPSVRIPSRIWFRESDEHEDVNRRQEHDEAVATVSSEPMDRHDNDKVLAAWSAWLIPLMQMPVRKPKNDNKQLVLDDYLEFLDRRYNRLHRNDSEETPIGINTAYDWLMNRSPPSHVSSAGQQDDSLCILGLAGLASEELLKKHHLPVPKDRPLEIVPASSVVIETSLSIDTMPPESTPSEKKPTLPLQCTRTACIATIKSSLSAGTRILRRIQAQREAVLAMQMHKVLFISLRQIARNALSVTKKIVLLGGGKQNLQSAAAFVLFFSMLLRPIRSATMQG